MNKKIQFSIPGLYSYFRLNMFLFDLMDRYPEKFNEDIVITSIYGSFPCIWDGGRAVGGDFNASDVKNAVETLNKRTI